MSQVVFKAINAKVESSMQKLVLIALADYQGGSANCYPSLQALADKCHCTKRCVTSNLKALEEQGHITRKQRSANGEKIPNLYIVHPQVEDQRGMEPNDTGMELDSIGIEPDSIPMERGSIGVGNEVPQGMERGSHRTTQLTTHIEPLKEPKEKKSGYTQEFELFWAAYPRSKNSNKRKSFDLFNKHLKNHSLASILAGTRAYARKCQVDQTDEKYIKRAETFLSIKDEHFLTEWEPDQTKGSSGNESIADQFNRLNQAGSAAHGGSGFHEIPPVVAQLGGEHGLQRDGRRETERDVSALVQRVL